LRQMNVEPRASMKPSGAAIGRIPRGSTERFQMTTHIITKAMTQTRSVVCHSPNRREIAKAIPANKNDQTTHSIAFTG